jgi:uncharacterized protein YbaR (Trm112 family)
MSRETWKSPIQIPRRHARIGLWLVLIIAVVTAVDGSPAQERRGPQVYGKYQGDRMFTVLELDAIPAIRDPKFVSDEAARRQMHAQEPVIGLLAGGRPRAYSTWQLDLHEIVNDVVDDRPIAVTWCPLCHTALVYDRRVKGKTLTLLVSGKLWRNSLVMQDVETGSLWSHVSGEALDGPLKGEQLTVLPAVQTTWERWGAAHPDTLVLHKPGAVEGSRYAEYAEDPGRFGLFRTRQQLGRLPGKALVHGISIGDHAIAVDDRKLEAGGWLELELAGEKVTVHRGPDGGVRAWYGTRSQKVADKELEPLPVSTAYWFAWVSYHPNSDLAP